MVLKRITAVILSVIMIVLMFPCVYAADGVVFSFSASVPSTSEVTLGDTVTYTVSLDSNGGFAFGSLFFEPSDNLEYVGATYKGESVTAEKAITGENEGSYGIIVAGESIVGSDNKLCTVTFRVTGEGDISVRFYAYQLNDGSGFVSATVNNATVTHKGKTLSSPEISTDSLPEAVMGYEYSHKLVGTYSEFLTYSYTGTLPDGVTLSPDGTLSGVPTEYGDFAVTVKATLLGKYETSKILTLTVLEKPRALELVSGSKYEIDGDLLRHVVEETTLSSLLANFKNAERIKVFSGSGSEVTEPDALIGTGYTVSLMHGDEKVHTVTVVVLGDVSGNGRVDPIDYQRVRRYIFGNYSLEGVYLEAALVSGREDVTPVDYQRIRRHIFGNYNIYE